MVTVSELDLELDAGEEQRRRVEDDQIPARLEILRKRADSTVLIRLRRRDRQIAASELHLNAPGR